MILLNQAGKNRHEDICASLELFAAEVMPEFHAREPEHQEWKQACWRARSSSTRSTPTPYNMPIEPDAVGEAQG